MADFARPPSPTAGSPLRWRRPSGTRWCTGAPAAAVPPPSRWLYFIARSLQEGHQTSFCAISTSVAGGPIMDRMTGSPGLASIASRAASALRLRVQRNREHPGTVLSGSARSPRPAAANIEGSAVTPALARLQSGHNRRAPPPIRGTFKQSRWTTLRSDRRPSRTINTPCVRDI